jgi:serine/threonine-protein kinase HipA
MAKPSPQDQVQVYLDDPAFGPIDNIGTLTRGDRGSIRFTYNQIWLDHANSFPLDPELDLAPGEFYPKGSNFGVFMDSCPDRWGSVLMQRREDVESKFGDRTRRVLGPWDYLLGVQDCTRMGALRFKRSQDEDFLASEALAAPPITRLAELQQIAFEVTNKKVVDLGRLREWLRVLVAPGASLGGARPKANIVENDGSLWIAKFPARDDTEDIAAYEKLVHDLARDCGIDVPESRLVRIGTGYHTFMVKRFDRDMGNRRFFSSAMPLLHRTDSEDASYLELAEFVADRGHIDHIEEDLEELFRRVVFNVVVANRDDHLRNHGFIRTPGGWRLAPAFDINPSASKEEHVLALDSCSRYPDLEVVASTADLYRLGEKKSREIIEQVCDVVSAWRPRAKRIGLSAQDCLVLEQCMLVP